MITGTMVATVAGQSFMSWDDIDRFFRSRTGKGYAAWFNGTLSGVGPWDGVKVIDTPENERLAGQFWDRCRTVFGVGGASAVQFACLSSIFANETRGGYSPGPEIVGMKGHPGMAYAFNKIPQLKLSYNTLPGNRTAFECFNDSDFIDAHGRHDVGGRYRRTTDTRWAGEVWPSGAPYGHTTDDGGIFIGQADFMKFRGRGMIQTTGRQNYMALIAYIKSLK